MDRLNQLRSEAGGSGDTTLDTSSPPSEAYLTANDSSKYFSLLEDESNFSISKDTTNSDSEATVTDNNPMISNLSPIPKKSDLDNYKIGKQIEAANILSGGVNIFDDNDNSYDGDDLVIDDNVTEADEKSNSELKLSEEVSIPYDKVDDNFTSTIDDTESAIPSKDTEVVLQIDGKNVDAIDIGNGLYLYRKEGEEELAAVQIIDDDQQQSSFKFLKVRENVEGNLEVYEEIEIEVPKEVPSKEGKSADNLPQVPIKDINKVVINEPTKVVEKKIKSPQKDTPVSEMNIDLNKELQSESKTEVNFNGKMMKFSESRKSPVIGSFTPMTFHSTPNKERIPLTKTMVDQHLHPSRHSDNVKKTIEVHTDSCKQKILDIPIKNNKEICDNPKTIEVTPIEMECKPISEDNSEEGEKPQLEKDVLLAVAIQESVKVKDFSMDKNKVEVNYATEADKADDVCKNNTLTQTIPKEQTKYNVINESVTASENKHELSETKSNNLLALSKNVGSGSTISIVAEKQDIEINNIFGKSDISILEKTSTGAIVEKDDLIEDDSPPVSKIISVENVCQKDKVSNIKDIQHTHRKKDDKIVVPGEANKNITKESTNDDKDSKKPVTVINPDLLNVETSKSVSNNPGLEQRKETTSKDKDISQQSLIKEIVNESSSLISDKKKLVKHINETNSAPKIELIQIDYKKIENSHSDDKIVINKLALSISHHKATNSKDVEKHSDETQRDSDTSLSKERKDSTKCHTEKIEISQVSNKTQSIVIEEGKTEPNRINKNVESKPINNNHAAAVPFGQWTEANRQEFLNKIKETKVPSNNSNAKQIKQPNDLNRRDILQKIDSQRQQQTNNAIAKVQEQQKLNMKNETTAFVKSTVKHDTKIPVKERTTLKNKPTCNKKNIQDELPESHPSEPSYQQIPNSNLPKKESIQRREINNQALIDKTIEDIINRVPPPKSSNEDSKQNVPNTDGIEKQKGMTLFGPSYHAKNEQSVTLDDIEMKMNELHGIPFVERPAHELPQKFNFDSKPESENNEIHKDDTNKAPNILPFAIKPLQTVNEVVNIDSDDEIIGHRPITGDVDTKSKSPEFTEKELDSETNQAPKISDGSKDVIITEKDFDKFFRRNSVTYENCLTVNFDGKEPHNVIQTVVEKEVAPKKLTRNEVLLAESKAKSTHKQQMLQARHNNHPTKIPTTVKYQTTEEESYGKNYQSKLQIAYQSALTAKRQKESPITNIEDKPVKVVFIDSNADFVPSLLNVQGEKLSPTKKPTLDLETFTHSTTDSLDSDVLDNFDNKSQDEIKTKCKHQRKQVLTPVEMPEMELIEPGDLGIEVSPKKKRKIEDKLEKSPRNHVPKKSYLLGRTTTEDNSKTQDVANISFKEITDHHNSFAGHANPISAIDNLVKAAELLENQAEMNSSSSKTLDSDSQQNTPVKRGRGRPRKYPLPDGEADRNKVPNPQKKPRLIDARVMKREETDDDETSDDEIIKENWTMGKINENIVCPICNKLFRSENVVFKHVKHCTGPSPNRSESDKRRLSESQDSEISSNESKSDMDIEEQELKTPKKRKSKESAPKVSADSDEVILIEDTPLKEKLDKHHESRKSTAKAKAVHRPNDNLVCEICGKTFRQPSYLAHHKLQHKNESSKKHDSDTNVIKSIFSCEVCKKEFRKLHHLVQHRIIHNPDTISSRTLRKSSSEHGDNKVVKDQNVSKQTEDQSAGFRCEPCDKSFRKLHHLVEHRETHDGINRQKATEGETVKPATTHQCDVCDKTFRKLQMLNEHKEVHLDTCSEKSDDKSVKSSLSTKDIIHECSLCYMVFPNEHSLNKHTIICLRKKKQSAAKAKQAAENKDAGRETIDSETPKQEEHDLNETDDTLIIVEDNAKPELNTIKESTLNENTLVAPKRDDNIFPRTIENLAEEVKEDKVIQPKLEPVKKSIVPKNKEEAPLNTVTEIPINKDEKNPSEISTKAKQIDAKEITKVQETPVSKKKTPAKEKVAATVIKRHKTINVPLPVIEKVTPKVESSDDDEIRYMLNPDFIEDETVEGKQFMKVKAKKRNSLQIERPTSKDLVKRSMSLQHPPKISRLKNRSLEQKSNSASTSAVPKSTNAKIDKPSIMKSSNAKIDKPSVASKSTYAKNDKPVAKSINSKIDKPSVTELVPSTDSDDSDIKYSFPDMVKNDVISKIVVEKKPQKRQSLSLKRRTLSGVAKRKSVGKAVNSKHKLNTTPAKPVKKRTIEVEHRCDCGQLFSSAALLSRHTTLDHTPPRIRRRRSPAPEIDTKTITKPVLRKSVSERSKPNMDCNKSSGQGNTNSIKPGVSTRKSSMNNNDAKASSETRKSVKSESSVKLRRSAAHKGVPVPEKMRKLMDKSKI